MDLPLLGGSRNVTHIVSGTLLLLLSACRLTDSQLFPLDATPVPVQKTLNTMYAFYMYSRQDAPDKSHGSPFVKFHSIAAHSTSTSSPDEKLANYHSVQLSIVPYNEFWQLLKPAKFCSDSSDVAANRAEAPNQLLFSTPEGVSGGHELSYYIHTVSFGADAAKLKDVEVRVRKTGVYVLVLSNCGTYDSATVSGSVVAKNAHGFLPGNEYHKMPFYGYLSLCYVMFALIWMGLSIRHWRELFHIQNCIAVVIFLGLLESFLWWIFFNDWNNSGSRGRVLFTFAILSTVVKSIFSYMLILVASLGWGVTRPYLDQKTIRKIQGVSSFYIILDFIREAVLSFRHSNSLPPVFVALCLVPVSLLNGGIFYWIFTALAKLIETLRLRGQEDKLALFQSLWRLLVSSLMVATIALLCKIFDLSSSISDRWHHQWFLSDGTSHLLFLLVLGVMMYLWAPTSNSKRYAYIAASDKSSAVTVDGKMSAIWEDHPADEEEEDESFWSTTHSSTNVTEGVKARTAVAIERVGATSENA